jgi:hypothetical protein
MILRKETQGTHNQTHLLVLAYVYDQYTRAMRKMTRVNRIKVSMPPYI